MITVDKLSGAFVRSDTSILEAVKAIDGGGIQAGLVVDAAQHLLGVVTDGDVRRGLLKGIGLDQAVALVMNSKPATLPRAAGRDEALALMRKLSIRQVPLLDGDGRIAGLHHINEAGEVPHDPDPPWVVIMAGGRGTRLHPLTETTPKPMLPVGGQPLIETIIRSLVSQGLSRIYLSVNYMSDVFKTHFGDGSRLGADIRYIEETDRLGTAGALGLMKERPGRPFLVMNGDLLTQVDFRNLIAFHAEHKAQATMCVRDYSIQIPYGVVDLLGTQVTDIVEKPTRAFFVNAGIYVLDPGILSHIPEAQYLDMPDLLKRAMTAGGKVTSFPIHEYWLDIGKFDDLERAQAEFHRWFGA